MAKISRNRRRAALTKARRKRSSMGWYVASGVIVVVGIGLVAANRAPADVAPLAGTDHWHSAFGVNICGTWLPPVPEFHTSAENANLGAGIHSHGDGLIHTHPVVAAEAGKKATVGKYMEYAGYSVSLEELDTWDGMVHKNGDDCNGEPGQIRWSVNGEEQSGDPSKYHMQDQDVIAIALIPEGEEIGTPPSAASMPGAGGTTPAENPNAPGITIPPDPSTLTDPSAIDPSLVDPGSTDPGATAPGVTEPGATPEETAAPTETTPATAAP